MLETQLILQGLVDGSRPLPEPHPQTLSFPNNPAPISCLATGVEFLANCAGVRLSEDEMRHVLFKTAAWCSRRGAVEIPKIENELSRIGFALQLMMTGYRASIASSAGISWYLKQEKRLDREKYLLARSTYKEPPKIIQIDWRGFHLAELTTPVHVQAEGDALGHCMGWSVNYQALAKRPSPQSAEDYLDCLTYAVKIRTGELRIFSVRDPFDNPMMTIAYDPKARSVTRMEGRKKDDHREWQGSRCDFVHALQNVVPVDKVFARVVCTRSCPKRKWCELWMPGSPGGRDLAEALFGEAIEASDV